MNSFFSTGMDRVFARRLAGENIGTADGLVSILFEVRIDTDVAAAPFIEKKVKILKSVHFHSIQR